MSLHKEIRLEEEICEHLGAHGWMYQDGVSASFDRGHALFPEDVIAWVQETQPEAWKTLDKAFGMDTPDRLIDRLRAQMDARGTLDVLRNGFDMVPARGKIQVAQFKPALGLNAETTAKYAANRLRVLRQVRYSEYNENCLDLVLFLNGIPVATAELKSDFTQSVADAVDQYKRDRQPRPKGQQPEPLLSFPAGALVHFAVSNTEVQMTTRLDGAATRFLPFNRGRDGGAGNPACVSPDTGEAGHPTAYLWEQVWARESWLEILGRYLVTERNAKKQPTGTVFPRFHQLDQTRKLVRAVAADGAGGKYLIQHSAGSGKTKSIAWSAHFLADLHVRAAKMFDTVIVISDRTVIDGQLRDEILAFERTAGVVETITGERGSKSQELAEALSGAKKIVVCTIQTFPALYDQMTELVRHKSKRFAVIADEAHSSQTGGAASKLKQVLTAEELEQLKDGGEVSTEDVLAAQMAGRAAENGITYVAYTATPKAKTMELFGTRPDPAAPASPGNLPAPFHVYTMRQAIEEGFILDVLRNYTPYSLAFRVAHNGKEMDDLEVERSRAVKELMWKVRLHPYNIAQKVQIVVEHFLGSVQPLLSGHAKAMVVVGSRKEAVRWQLAISKYIRTKGYHLTALVAFSGEVIDPESGPDPFTENSKELNPTLNGRDMRQAFNTDDFQVLLVANKFQTGFDQPLLCGMYVDRRLAGIQAVQTLSRLNRAYAGPFGRKDTTYVLDFVNEPGEILEAFKPYFETAELAATTDPNLVYNVIAKLDAGVWYAEGDVERVAKLAADPRSKQAQLIGILQPVAQRMTTSYGEARTRHKEAVVSHDDKAATLAHSEMEALLMVRKDMQTFVSAYTFLSQIFDYGNTAVEKRFIFYKALLPLLEFERDLESIDLSKVVLTHHNLRNQGARNIGLTSGDGKPLEPMTDAGSATLQEKEKARLSEIIQRLNDLFGAGTTDGDKLRFVETLRGKLAESETLSQQASQNTKEQFTNSPDLDAGIMNAGMEADAAFHALTRQFLASATLRTELKHLLLGPGLLYETLRDRPNAASAP